MMGTKQRFKTIIHSLFYRPNCRIYIEIKRFKNRLHNTINLYFVYGNLNFKLLIIIFSKELTTFAAPV